MKIIELLDKMATGQISTKAKVKYGNARCKHESWESLDFYIHQELGKRCESEFKDFLNDEIEIIEEDKKIEKIKILTDEINMEYIANDKGKKLSYSESDLIFADRINKLIDEVNKLKGENK